VAQTVKTTARTTVQGKEQESGNENKYVFSLSLNTDSDEADVTSLGRLFHASAAATAGKARPPTVDRRQ